MTTTTVAAVALGAGLTAVVPIVDTHRRCYLHNTQTVGTSTLHLSYFHRRFLLNSIQLLYLNICSYVNSRDGNIAAV